MKRIIFDSHAHYDDEWFSEVGREQVIEKVFESGVKYILNAGTNYDTCKSSVALTDKYDGFYAAVGFYPHECISINDDGEAVDFLKKLLQNKKVVGIGEIGLDYHYDDTPRDIQKKWFDIQLSLANETGYPVIVHDREAHGDTLDMIKAHSGVKGMLHSFSGSYETAKELIKLGWYISISGVVTYKNAVKTVEVVKNIPLERLLLETDSPYLSPVPNRGKMNDSSNIWHTAAKIAEVRGMPVEELIEICCANSCRLFGIE